MRQRLKVLVITWAILAKASALAQVGATPSLGLPAQAAKPSCLAMFSKTYRSYNFYIPGWCPHNIFRLANQFKNAKVDLTSSRVLIISHAFVYDLIEAQAMDLRGKNRVQTGWYYHVVLEHEGEIFDFDNLSHPVPLRDYFQQMFNAGSLQSKEGSTTELGPPDPANVYMVRAIPALYYLKYFLNKIATVRRQDMDFTFLVTQDYFHATSIGEYLQNHEMKVPQAR